jgi:hypothetical protein
MTLEPATVIAQLAAAVQRRLAGEGARNLQVIPLDRDRDGRYRGRAGLEVGRDRVVHAHYAAVPLPALLFVGMHRASSSAHPGVAALLEWPGLAQLAYGATWREFRDAAAHVVNGARSPLPAGVLAPVEDILRISSEVRHWLRNRLRNGEAAVDILERSMRGEIRLHPSNLRPVAAVSREHMDVLERFWAHERPAQQLAPSNRGVAGVKDALDSFTRCWDAIEAARAVVREAAGAPSPAATARLLLRHQQACDTLHHAIALTLALDDELKASREN